MTVIVSGASGWLGQAVLKALQQLGSTVIPLYRDQPLLYSPELSLHGDLSNPKLSEKLASQYVAQKNKVDCFIHCAGIAHRPDETPEIKRLFKKVNVNGTEQVLKFCRQVSIKRFVYVGSIASYEWNGAPQYEQSNLKPKTEYARTKLEGENLVMQSFIDWRIVRLATVFGEGDKANFLKLSTAMRKRRFLLPGEGKSRKSVIPIELAAQLISELALIETPKHQLLNLALPQAPTLQEICRTFSESCQYPLAPSVPLPVLNALAWLGNLINPIQPFPLTSNTLSKLITSTWVDTTRMQETFPAVSFHSFSHYMKDHSHYYRKT